MDLSSPTLPTGSVAEVSSAGGTLLLSLGPSASCCRLSVRAFTQLFDEDNGDPGSSSPLFTDTFLSLPLVTEAGERARPPRALCSPAST